MAVNSRTYSEQLYSQIEDAYGKLLYTYTVSFFGHRMIDNIPKVEEQVEEIVRYLIHEKQYVEFLVGRDGDFDQIVASTVRRVKRAVRDDNSVLVWVMPYPSIH